MYMPESVASKGFRVPARIGFECPLILCLKIWQKLVLKFKLS
jgi:hypothetical protein